MKKMTLKKLFGGICCAAMAMFAVSCAQGVDDEVFKSDVSNVQLTSPDVEGFVISSQTNSDGSESLVVEWPQVYGAGGYYVTVAIVDDPANPTFLNWKGQAHEGEGEEGFVDGCRIVFEKLEDTNYEVRIRTAGNEKLNNTEAAEPSVFSYSTLVPAEKVTGTDIAEFINNYMAENAETLLASHQADANFEIAFELEAGQEYTMNSKIDLGLITTTIRTNSKTNNARVIMGEDSGFILQAGLKVKFVNFDCSLSKQNAFFELSSTPDESIKDANLLYKGGNATYKQLGASKGAYIIEDPIVLQDCLVKNMPKSFVYSSKGYGLMDLRIVRSIVQMKNESGQQFILMQSGNTGIKDMTFSESTVFDTATKGLYFIALNNQNRPKIFGSAASTSSWRFEASTLYFTGKRSDRTKADSGHTNYFIDMIFYNVQQLNRFYGTFEYSNTTVYEDSGTAQSYDAEVAAGGAPVNPGFVGPIAELDLTQKNGGVNLQPTAAPCVDGKRGDPRWF